MAIEGDDLSNYKYLDRVSIGKPITIMDNPHIKVIKSTKSALDGVSVVIWNRSRTKTLDHLFNITDLFITYRYIIKSFGFNILVEIQYENGKYHVW